MRVYHFLAARWAEDDLTRRRLKVSRFDDLNDPFELLALELRDREVRRAFQEMRQHVAERRGVLCFSCKWWNPLLWSHYGDKHRGACLGFDIPDKFIAKVHYDAKRLPDIVEDVIGGGPEAVALVTRLLATKFQDWKYEDEVRVYCDLEVQHRDAGFYFRNFDESLVLAEVILGPRYSGSKATVLKLACSFGNKVDVVQARLAFRSFRVVKDKRGVV